MFPQTSSVRSISYSLNLSYKVLLSFMKPFSYIKKTFSQVALTEPGFGGCDVPTNLFSPIYLLLSQSFAQSIVTYQTIL